MSDDPARDRRRFRGATRAVTPIVGKTLEIGLVVLFVSMLTATLFGGVVPTYQTAVGDEVADRTLAMAAERVEAAVPSASADATVSALDRTVRVSLPSTIRGRVYRIRATETRSLVLDHPHPEIGGETRLVLPATARAVGEWPSDGDSVANVSRSGDGVTVRLEDRR